MVVLVIFLVAIKVELKLGLKNPLPCCSVSCSALGLFDLGCRQFWVLIKFQFQVFRFNFSVFFVFHSSFLKLGLGFSFNFEF